MSEADSDGDVRPIEEVLLAAREAGFLGPGPITRHLRHARGFLQLAEEQSRGNPEPHVMDLGSGGGLPGLVIADEWPGARLVLLDANRRRTLFLEQAVRSCGFQHRVQVVNQRAEVCGRDPEYRGNFDGVVVRSFGPPAVVAECAAPFLREGGWVIVSEPPTEVLASAPDTENPERHPEEDHADESERWPSAGLALLGLSPFRFVWKEFGYQILHQDELCPDKFPRRDGVPSRKPLFS